MLSGKSSYLIIGLLAVVIIGVIVFMFKDKLLAMVGKSEGFNLLEQQGFKDIYNNTVQTLVDRALNSIVTKVTISPAIILEIRDTVITESDALYNQTENKNTLADILGDFIFNSINC